MRRKEQLPILAVTCGDPAGVGPEIAVRAAVSRGVRRQARLVLVGPESVWKAAARVVGVGLRLTPFERRGRRPLRRGTVEFVPTAEPGEWQWGKISAAGGEAAFCAVEKAAKESLRAAAVPYIGHTEILAGLTQSEDPLTVFLTGKLCVFFFTRHLPLSEVPERLKTEPLRCFILRCRDTLREWGIAHPKLAVAGFNPHCGEHGLLGREEILAVEPAVRAAAAEGVDAVGPIGADSVFAQAAEGRYDAVVSLYHDQGHIACKTLDFHRTVSVTAGLPFLRVSVDHGTAFDIAGTGRADATGMKEALRVAAAMVVRRRGSEKKNCQSL